MFCVLSCIRQKFFQFPELAPALLRYLSLDSLELNGAHAGREFGENNADGEEQGSEIRILTLIKLVYVELTLFCHSLVVSIHNQKLR